MHTPTAEEHLERVRAAAWAAYALVAALFLKAALFPEEGGLQEEGGVVPAPRLWSGGVGAP
ncbi:hypothetical protein ACIOJD_09920 [Streptomyces sp. NPDC088116]|uniref:hypothetical protein n=1 Tax=Streptomyces sp. NPDC088116 TaxID=3365825 RepID=UPI003801940C